MRPEARTSQQQQEGRVSSSSGFSAPLQQRRVAVASSQGASDLIRSDPIRSVSEAALPQHQQDECPHSPSLPTEDGGNADGGNADDDDDGTSSLEGVSEEIQFDDDDSYNKDKENYTWYCLRMAKPLVKAIREKKPLSVLRAIVKRRPESVRGRTSVLGEPDLGDLPLHYAVREGAPVEHVKFIYNCWPDANQLSAFTQRLPLHAISDKTPVETVEFLVDMYPGALSLVTYPKDLPIHAGITNGAALDVVRVLVERCPESVLKPNDSGFCPIHLAVVATTNPRQLEVVRYLAQQRPASLLQRAKKRGMPANEDDDDGYLPIHIAAAGTSNKYLPVISYADSEGGGLQQLEVIQFLAEACPESLGMTASGGILPVHQALRSNVAPGVVQLLVRTLPESIPDETRLGLLHFAVRQARESLLWAGRFYENVAALAEALPESLRAANSKGSLPIHVAASLGARSPNARQLELAHRLANLDPDSLLLPNANGKLPLHIAIVPDGNTDGSAALARFLLECRPQAAQVAMTDGNFAIHCAIERRMFGLVRFMVGLVPETLTAGALGRTPLHVAVAPRFDVIFYFSKRESDGLRAVVHLLIEGRPDSLLVRDSNNDLPLHVAIAHFSEDVNRRSEESDWTVQVVTTLLDRSPDSIRVQGAGEKLPLHVAVAMDAPSLPLVRLLVERCPESLDTKDAQGKLPLQVAISKNPPSLPLVRLLVEGRPESLETKDAEGNLPFVLAAEKARFLALDNQTASLGLIYWLLRKQPEPVASHRGGRRYAAPL